MIFQVLTKVGEKGCQTDGTHTFNEIFFTVSRLSKLVINGFWYYDKFSLVIKDAGRILVLISRILLSFIILVLLIISA